MRIKGALLIKRHSWEALNCFISVWKPCIWIAMTLCQVANYDIGTSLKVINFMFFIFQCEPSCIFAEAARLLPNQTYYCVDSPYLRCTPSTCLVNILHSVAEQLLLGKFLANMPRGSGPQTFKNTTKEELGDDLEVIELRLKQFVDIFL